MNTKKALEAMEKMAGGELGLIALIDAGIHLGFSGRKINTTMAAELGIKAKWGICGFGVCLYSWDYID
ncbi:MAG: hypothetical protein LBK92_03835 [Endomicrobium sp.]|jgi:hypothetical protein|nr:hypothetical protein [Endomicrobium sp.]